ncbi:Serine/threonine protein phosphatase PrpC [Friedmanniella luteola]|uniref:Serine/threonine protein phosphatase PrpC n=1 Tax=Friedmanniella luteola TaxID=546871 RepID=A0A1H1TD90_9ACTN|nr:protein phosphatase 2C domain-containing protein [Friedmanniella luteola]SDS58190.1 Serine/threonine protein phosphatase PrpC [Friedmanniella luteola]
MSEPRRSGADAGAPGPTVSFGFNLGKIADHGEDSDPILRDGPDLGLLAVFDGMGGAGGTVYETEDGSHSGAYLASRLARDVVEHRMLDLLVPDWNLKGEAAAADLQRAVQAALQDRLAELKAPKSALRSRLLRALPTTMAMLALQRTQRGGSRWLCHTFWAGDSRAYVFEPGGARQLTTDDLREPSDAMTNLHRDSVVSNAMSADTAFHVNYRRVELRAPFLLVSATDGCFGYLPSPMHFEHLVLSTLLGARNVAAWSQAIQDQVSVVTGDDAAMSVMAVGADLDELKALYAPRVEELEQQFTTPIDELGRAVQRAEQELQQLRQRQLDDTQRLWARYQPGYERYLHAAPEPDGEAGPEPAPEQRDAAVSPPDGEGAATAPAGSEPAAARDEVTP